MRPVRYKPRFDVLRNFLPVSQISAQGYVAAVQVARALLERDVEAESS